jgi:ubiquinone/menaquinone biosynthesis C-methylase UbiE
VAQVSEPDSTGSRFDRRASTYEDSTLQQFLFGPVQRTALRLARQLLPQARRILDVGCGTGRLLRHARPYYPTAQLVGVDLAGQMVATATHGLGIVRFCLIGVNVEQARFPAIMWLSKPMTRTGDRACPHIIAHHCHRRSSGSISELGA